MKHEHGLPYLGFWFFFKPGVYEVQCSKCEEFFTWAIAYERRNKSKRI